MKRFSVMLVLALFAAPFVAGCHDHDDDHDKTTVKMDTKGEHKGVEVDHK